MRFTAALIKQQNVAFAVVIVKKHILDGPKSEKDNAKRAFQPAFPGVPIILMAQDHRGVPTYYGRRDIVDYLANLDFRRIPWSEYSWN